MYILHFALRILLKEPLRCHMDGRIYKSVEYHLVHLQFRYCITVESGIETRFYYMVFLICTCTVHLFHLRFDTGIDYS